MDSLTQGTDGPNTQQAQVNDLGTQGPVLPPTQEEAEWQPSEAAYAEDHLFAVVEDSRAAQRASQALLEHRFPAAEVHVYSGPAHAQQLEQQEMQQGAVRFFRKVQEAFTYDEHTTRTWYPRALRQGRSVIMVHCSTDEQVQEAADILARQGAHHLVYYGRWNIQTVRPEKDVTTGEPREQP